MARIFRLLFGVWGACAHLGAQADQAINTASYFRKVHPPVVPGIDPGIASRVAAAVTDDPPVPDPDKQMCLPQKDATVDELKTLKNMNCLRVGKAVTSFSSLTKKYDDDVVVSWAQRSTEAMKLCQEADAQPPDEAALLALKAWGDVMMQGHECCSLTTPPFCLVPRALKTGHYVPFVFSVLLIFMAYSSRFCCRKSVSMPNLFRTTDVVPGEPLKRNVKLVITSEEWLGLPQDTLRNRITTELGKFGMVVPPVQIDDLVSENGKASADFMEVGEAERAVEELRRRPNGIFTITSGRRSIDPPLGGGGGRVPTGGLRTDLRPKLNSIFNESSLSNLDGGNHPWRRSVTELFEALHDKFGFQKDSVANQLENFLSLWRSQCAMVADRAYERTAGDIHSSAVRVNEEELLANGLFELHAQLLDGFQRYKEKLDNYKDLDENFGRQRPRDRDRRPLPHDPLPRPFGALWKEPPKHGTALAQVVTFLLVWGEAGNVRFMPEAVYFITHLLLSDTSEDRTFEATGGRSCAFLARVIRPLYNRIFDENYLEVGENKGKDAKKLHGVLDKFLPADCANYDDWNDLFLDPERLCDAIVTRERADGTRTLRKLFRDYVGSERTRQLANVDWDASLRDAKTHREVHSIWGLFATIHRVVFLHVALYLLTLTMVAQPNARSGGILVVGNAFSVRLCTTGLLVPCHAACKKLASWFTAGSAVRTREYPEYSKLGGVHAWGAFKGFMFFILWALPFATYAGVRYLELQGDSAQPLLQKVVVAHLFVSACGAFTILCVPGHQNPSSRETRQWPFTRVPCASSVTRWLFWLLVLSVKAGASLGGVRALNSAINELMICRPGQEAIRDLPHYAFSPHWDQDVLQWSCLIGTGLFLYVTDTQFWFSLGCSILGVIIALQQRAWQIYVCFFEDSVAKIPERFSQKVFPYTHDPACFQWIWNKIIDNMRKEDVIATVTDLRYTGSAPQIFQCEHTLLTRVSVRQLGIGRAGMGWPESPDAEWRLLALSRGLTMELPRPFRAPYIPGLTVLIPHYGETILSQTQELRGVADDQVNDVVPLMSWLEKRYSVEFKAFCDRQHIERTLHWHLTEENRGYSDLHWKKIEGWASMRSQVLFRTVAGLTLYHEALAIHFEKQRVTPCMMMSDEPKDSEDDWKRWLDQKVSEMFTCMVSMQMYPTFDKLQFDQTNRMLRRFKSLKIAYIDFERKNIEDGEIDKVHPRQVRRYFSCLIDAGCEIDKDLALYVPKFRVELPGYPILGDGKGDNQNHAIPFTRGMFIQAIDANQGGYLEQMLLLPCVLGEFRSCPWDGHPGQFGSQKIVGFPEHITSDIGTIGDFAAGAEVAMGTILQRSYSALGGRMHYGHPDMMNRAFMIQQGGVSKATKTVNLSEDIFAGMDFTLRGQGRTIQHSEYFHVSKGRDMGFGAVLGFFSKLSAGTGEQLLTRQTARLCEHMGLPEALTFYYAHGGFYLTNFLVSKSIPLLVFIWLLVLLNDAESNFEAFDAQSLVESTSAAGVMAKLLISQFGWVMILFLVAAMAPLLFETTLQNGFITGVIRSGKQLLTCSPWHFIFQAKLIGFYVSNEIMYGGAKYVATGRGLPIERRSFINHKKRNRNGELVKDKDGNPVEVTGLYDEYAPLALYDGAELLVGTCLALIGGGLDVEPGLRQALVWWMIALFMTITSWLFAPFIFNPYQYVWHSVWEDVGHWRRFFTDKPEPWLDWYTRTQLEHGKGIRTSPSGMLFSLVLVGAWYTVLINKVHLLVAVFPGNFHNFMIQLLVVLPPVFGSGLFCLSLSLLLVAWDVLGACFRLCGVRMRVCIQLEVPEPDAQGEPAQLGAAPRLIKWPQDGRGIQAWRPRLILVAIVAGALDGAEAIATLYKLAVIGWTKSFLAGLVLKYTILSMLLSLVECFYRLKPFRTPEQEAAGAGAAGARCFENRLVDMMLSALDFWLLSHRMLRDLVVSTLILLGNLPFVLLDRIRICIFGDFFSLHNLLIFRDPGHPTNTPADMGGDGGRGVADRGLGGRGDGGGGRGADGGGNQASGQAGGGQEPNRAVEMRGSLHTQAAKSEKVRKVEELSCCEDNPQLPDDPFAIVIFGSRREVPAYLPGLYEESPKLRNKPHIITGTAADVEDIHETLVGEGIKEEDIYQDKDAKNTDDNATFAVTKLKELGGHGHDIVFFAFPVLACSGKHALIHHGLPESRVHAAFPAALIDVDEDSSIADAWVDDKYEMMRTRHWAGRQEARASD